MGNSENVTKKLILCLFDLFGQVLMDDVQLLENLQGYCSVNSQAYNDISKHIDFRNDLADWLRRYAEDEEGNITLADIISIFIKQGAKSGE